MAGLCWMVGILMPAIPVLAQTDGISGRTEFRSADRPIPTPPLGSVEGAASDSKRSLTIGSMSADDVLKHIDRQLARTATGSTAIGDDNRAEASSSRNEAPDRQGLGGTTFK